MKLTFDSGKFILSDFAKPLWSKLIQTGAWRTCAPGQMSTTSLQAAADFRSSADEKTEKIFSSVFNREYEDPCQSQPLFLDPVQVEGVRWVLTRKNSYLAHAPGTGKTAETIVAAVQAGGVGQTVFIVPPSLTENWRREILKFTEMIDKSSWPTIAVVPQTTHKLKMNWSADFIIVPDSMLSKTWVYEQLTKMKIRFLAVDEASRFKEADTTRTVALFGGGKRGGTDGGYSYKGLTRKPRHVVLLDGSPMPNRSMELWAPTYALDPETIECMDQTAFGHHYCGARLNDRGQWEFNHSSNESELRERLRARFMHVVTEDQLAHTKGARRLRSIVFMNEDVRSAEHKAWDRKNLSNLTIADLDDKADQGDLARLRRELGLRKLDWSERYIRERLASGESILVFVWHREVAFELQKRLSEFKPAFIIGGVDARKREQAIQDFQAGKTRLGILNISAAGRGHNLQKADRCIFVEFSWTDELNKQCEHRAARRGRDGDVRADYIACPNSIDEVVLNSNFTKERRVRKVIG